MTTMGGLIVSTHVPRLSMCFLIEQAVQSIPFGHIRQRPLKAPPLRLDYPSGKSL